MKVEWFEFYRNCGCVSRPERRKKDLPGYCGIHGNDVASVHRVVDIKESL